MIIPDPDSGSSKSYGSDRIRIRIRNTAYLFINNFGTGFKFIFSVSKYSTEQDIMKWTFIVKKYIFASVWIIQIMRGFKTPRIYFFLGGG
jgi:hypothetical protein